MTDYRALWLALRKDLQARQADLIAGADEQDARGGSPTWLRIRAREVADCRQVMRDVFHKQRANRR